MQIQKSFLFLIAITMLFVGCEMPKKPDFTTSHKVEAPLMFDKTFQLMGDSTALIDTTSSELDSLFVIDRNTFPDNEFITISKEQDFEFGDLNDAIPIIDVDPTTFESEVGEIEITNLASDDGGNLGEAGFQDLTGIDPSFVDQGDPVPQQTVSPEVTVDLNTDLFESATFKDGALDITLQNNLGFNLDDINVVLVSDPDPNVSGDENDVANGNSGTINDGEQTTISIPFNNCDDSNSACRLFNPNVRVSIEWTADGTTSGPNSQTFQREPESVVVNSAEGNNLTASQVRAALDEQDFSTTSVATFDDEEFVFEDPSHFVELKSGEVVIAPIENQLEFDIDMVITFTDIRDCPASAANSNPFVTSADPLVISYVGDNRIVRSGTTDEATIDLTGCEIRANGNEVSYDISSITENTKEAPAGERIRVINETQSISSSVEISNMAIDRATGIVKQQIVLLNDDEGADEQLALFNDNEAEITEIDGLDELSRQLENLNFTNPSLSINYETNISVPTTIYGAFVGTNGQGEQVYLRGTSTDFSVQSSDPIDGLNKRDGEPLSADEMVKFSLAENTDGSNITSSITFNRTNTNVDDFLNNLPSDIRFIGKAVINEDEQEATIIDPLEFEPKISIDIPLALATPEAATYVDTVKQDLGNLPSREEGSSGLSEGRIIIEYENGLPLGFNLEIQFLDENFQPFSPTPLILDDIGLLAAEVDGNGFSLPLEQQDRNTMEIALDASELDQLYKTRHLRVSAALNTKDGDEVRLRTTDSIKLTVRAELTIESEVN